MCKDLLKTNKKNTRIQQKNGQKLLISYFYRGILENLTNIYD
jgi:hypothetical protein